MYTNGWGVERDYKKAVEYYLKATGQGRASAQNNLASMYYDGRGVEQDYKKAFDLYNQAMRSGDNTYAPFNIARLYADGLYLEQNIKDACMFYYFAYLNGNKAAESKLKELEDNASRLLSLQIALAKLHAMRKFKGLNVK